METVPVKDVLEKLRDSLKGNDISYGFVYSSDGSLECIQLSIKIAPLPCSIFEYKLAEKIAERHKVKCYVNCDNWAEDRSEDELKYLIRYGITCSYKEEEIKEAIRKLINAKNELEKVLE